MNNDQPSSRDARRPAGEYEMENEHEKKRRIRGERLRKWRKETRHPRFNDFDERTSLEDSRTSFTEP